MTDPKLAIATDRGRYYKDPAGGPDLVSVTNVIDTCVNKPVLVPWAAKVTCEYVMANLPTIVRRSLREKDAVIKEIKQQVKYVKETAADLGSRVHAHAEAMVLGKPIAADEEVAPFADQLVRFFRSWRVDFARDIEAAEISVAHRSLGYAGTADLFVWLPTGPKGARELWLIDYKTSTTRPATSIYPEYRLQLAALRHAEVLWLPDDSDGAMPRIDRTGILNLRQKSHALMPVEAGPKEFAAFSALVTGANWLKEAASDKPQALTPPDANTKRGAA